MPMCFDLIVTHVLVVFVPNYKPWRIPLTQIRVSTQEEWPSMAHVTYTTLTRKMGWATQQLISTQTGSTCTQQAYTLCQPTWSTWNNFGGRSRHRECVQIEFHLLFVFLCGRCRCWPASELWWVSSLEELLHFNALYLSSLDVHVCNRPTSAKKNQQQWSHNLSNLEAFKIVSGCDIHFSTACPPSSDERLYVME